MTPHRLNRAQARRIAVRAQQLTADRPTDLVELVDRLSLLQIDPTSAIAPSADLVAWSRLGADYQPSQLTRALETDRTLVELVATIRPTSRLPIYLSPSPWTLHPSGQRWFAVNESFRGDLLAQLEAGGPLLSRDLTDTCVEPWPSSGWNNNRNISRMLEIMLLTGDVAVSGRRGRQRLFDLAARVYPEPVERLTPAEAKQQQDVRRLRALGIARATTSEPGGTEPLSVGDAGEPAVIDGIPGDWRVDPMQLDDHGFEGRTALLSPFDRLIHDRVRAQVLFDFEYILEMYKPAAKRRWGYFALPVLHEDRLVGKLDAKADGAAGVLQINAVHQDVTFGPAITAAIDQEIEALANWLGLRV